MPGGAVEAGAAQHGQLEGPRPGPLPIEELEMSLHRFTAATFRQAVSRRPAQPLSVTSFRSLFIQTEPTPNEDAIIFKPGQAVLGGTATVEFTTPQLAARKSRLAAEIFSIEGVSSVLFGPDFISVNKRPEALWIHMKPEIFAAIMDHYTMHKDEAIISADKGAAEAESGGDSMAVKEGDSEVVRSIKEILETRIRPVIQGDGGDLSYEGFDEAKGLVKLKLQGACRSCSSSVVTLKNGIENMLKFYIPEVKEVTQVEDATEQLSEAAFREFEHKRGLDGDDK